MRRITTLFGTFVLATAFTGCRPKPQQKAACVATNDFAGCDHEAVAAERDALDVTIASIESRLKILDVSANLSDESRPVQYDTVRAAAPRLTEHAALTTQLENARNARKQATVRIAQLADGASDEGAPSKGACVVLKDDQVTGVIRAMGEGSDSTARRRCDDLREKTAPSKGLEYRYVDDVDADPRLSLISQ